MVHHGYLAPKGKETSEYLAYCRTGQGSAAVAVTSQIHKWHRYRESINYNYCVRGSREISAGWVVPPAATQIRCPDGKFERGNDGGVTRSDKHDGHKVLYIQETKWKRDRAWTLAGGYKMLHAGGDGKSNGVGVIVSEEETW